MIDYIKNPDVASKFVADKLVEVKHILDEIAEETGVIYVAMPDEMVSFVGRIGTKWANWLSEAQKVIADRLNLALHHNEWMLQRHPDGEQTKQDDPNRA